MLPIRFLFFCFFFLSPVCFALEETREFDERIICTPRPPCCAPTSNVSPFDNRVVDGQSGGCARGGVPSRLNEYAGWYFQVYARVRLLRRQSSTCGSLGWVPTHWDGSQEGGFKKTARGGGGGGLTVPWQPLRHDCAPKVGLLIWTSVSLWFRWLVAF